MRMSKIATRLGARLLAAVGVTILAMSYVPATRSQELKDIRIGSSTVSFSPLTIYYAAERGFFEREGINPRMVVIKTEVAIAALNAGELDYTTFSTSTIDAALSGFPIRLLAVLVQQPVQGLVVQKEIGAIADLKGKRVGISSFGGLTYAAAVEVLKHYGLDTKKDVALLAAGRGPQMIAGLQNRSLDAAFISAPSDIQASREGFKVLLETGTIFKFPYGGLSATVKKIRENPAEIDRVIRAVMLATRAVVDPNNKEDVVRYIMKPFRLNRQDSLEFYERLVPALKPTGIVPRRVTQRAIDMAVEKGVTDKPLDPDQIVDFSFVKKLK